jgi:hypothetical protein
LFQLQPQYEGVLLSISGSAGQKIADVYTLAGGVVELELEASQYVVVLSFENWVFNSNNIAVDTAAEDFGGIVDIDATRSVPAAAPPQGFTVIKFTLLQATGDPMAGTKVLFAPRFGTQGNAVVVKDALAVTTDSRGYGEIRLISGIEVVVNVEGTRIYETFVVPNTPTANLFDLITFADKGFESYLADFDAGIRRTLNP